MTPLMIDAARRVRLAASVLIASVLVACGGGNGSDANIQAATVSATPRVDSVADTAVGHKMALAATVNTEGPANTLTVRAYATLAGNIGALMTVRVDGVEVGTQEVRATEPADYSFAVPALVPGTKVDVVYTNDAVVGGVDRNLFITQLMAGNTYILPNAPGVTIDRGVGTAAFDGIDVMPGQSGIYWNAALRLTWPEPNLTSTVTVRASGVLAGNTGPLMALRVDGVVVGSTEVRANEPTDYVFAVPPLAVGSQVDVVYTNHAIVDGQARNLSVHYLRAGNTVLLPTAAGATIDAGSGLAAFDGVGVQAGRSALNVNGALRARWPAANMRDNITVRASALQAGSAVMELRIDGVVLGSVELRSTTPADFSFASLPIQPGSQIELLQKTPGSIAVAYLLAGTTVLRPADAGVVANAASLRGAWPSPNLTDTLTVRARSSLASGVGAIMQVLVDGVLLGSTEVHNTDFADFNFPSLSMQPGRKVDVVFTNDAFINGEDRNLYIDYLVSGTTFMRPDATGAVIDRGVGAAAFDGVDVIAGQGGIAWNGAWRATWPQPNITDSVTVRTSATLAGNVGAILQLRVDGVAVSSVEVRSPTLADYSLPTPTLKPGSKVELVFTNPGAAAGVQRQLNLAYLLAGGSVLRTDAAGAVSSPTGLQGTWPSANLTDTLTVRAHGTLAGNVGPIMQVLVDGVMVGTVEVRATDPTDYAFAVPALRQGSKIDVAYTNDAVVGGVDRNLIVSQLMAGKTYALPNMPGALYDLGMGAAAFDGLNVLPGQSGMHSNGALRLTWPAANLTGTVTVRASSVLAGNTGPVMALRVDGVVVGSTEVRASTPTDYVFAVPPLAVGSKVDVVYTNHAVVDGVARNLSVHYLRAGNTVLLPTANGVTIDQGSGLAAFDGAGVQAGRSALNSNGALRASWPTANLSDTITVRASAAQAANVGASFELRVDGVVLGIATLRSTSPADFSFASLPLKPGSQIELLQTTPGSVAVAYLLAGTTVLRPGDAGVVATATSLRSAWPAPNLTDTLTVRARSSLASGVGAIMQVLVDGVLLGSTEVPNTAFADFNFHSLPMQPGRKVDVVFTNDAFINGEDRNLYLDYLVSGTTFMRPNAPGAVIDRGNGAAAYDNLDVIAGHGNLVWNGAWRATWPQPNITDRVTVRASATLAGNVGAILLLRVDGVAVSSMEVRSPTLTDYSLPTPTLKIGSKIDVVYINDAVIDGADRNLTVAYVMAGSTVVQANAANVVYDLGSGNDAFDDTNTLPGQTTLGMNGALRFAWPSPNITDTLIVRASASLAGGVGALMQVRVDGVVVGTTEVRSTTGTDYVFGTPAIKAGSRVDLVFLNDAVINGEDRNLYVQYIRTSAGTLASVGAGVRFDAGTGEAAFDGQGVELAAGSLTSAGAMRFIVPSGSPLDPNLAAKYDASRFLQQASFGPTLDQIDRVVAIQPAAWLAEQMAIPATPNFVAAMQTKYALGDAYRPKGNLFTNNWINQRFWANVAGSPDQLRTRVAFALHQIFMVSQTDSNLYEHSRAYAKYLDTLSLHAFGNYRTLLEEIALSPTMGLYLSHIRNRPEDQVVGRQPDENFAREVMQLFTIGLHELNSDGSVKLGADGQPIETYNNSDVMAMAKVFTGWSWGMPDNQLTEANFRWAMPNYSAANDTGIDLLRMKNYPGQHSMAEKRLFDGKPWAAVIPAGSSANEGLRIALDSLFNHPNVGPFVGRQLIQRLVTSHPSASYVARVTAAFNNNGRGVRGDLAAVVRAVLLDAEARTPPADAVGKLREPVLRVGHWMRSMGASSITGDYLMTWDLEPQSQRVFYAPSVFGYFRPGFVPPNTAFATNGITVPELQIVNESTSAAWVNMALAMSGGGLGWTGSRTDVFSNLSPLVSLVAAGDVTGLIERLNLLLYAGRMSPALKQDILDAVTSVYGNTADSYLSRARVALFLSLASPDYLVQR